jgi:hypothetical protein
LRISVPEPRRATLAGVNPFRLGNGEICYFRPGTSWISSVAEVELMPQRQHVTELRAMREQQTNQACRGLARLGRLTSRRPSGGVAWNLGTCRRSASTISQSKPRGFPAGRKIPKQKPVTLCFTASRQALSPKEKRITGRAQINWPVKVLARAYIL